MCWSIKGGNKSPQIINKSIASVTWENTRFLSKVCVFGYSTGLSKKCDFNIV